MRFKIPDLIRLEIRYFLNNKKLLKARSWVNEHPLVVGYTSIISVFVLLVVIIVLLIPDGKREACGRKIPRGGKCLPPRLLRVGFCHWR